jgi:integrase
LTSGRLSSSQRPPQRSRISATSAGWGDHPLADDLVFRSEDGAPVTPALFSQWFETQTKAAGLPRIRLHDLRHGHAIQLRDAGVPAEVISKRLGHASVAFTIDT